MGATEFPEIEENHNILDGSNLEIKIQKNSLDKAPKEMKELKRIFQC